MVQGYKEPSGVYFHEFDPYRFIRPYEYTSIVPITTVSGEIWRTGIIPDAEWAKRNSQYFSGSFDRIMWYNLGEYDSVRKNIVSSGLPVASAIMDWLRSKESMNWFYYDLGVSGQFLRHITVNTAYPFDDLSIVTGDYPVNPNANVLSLVPMTGDPLLGEFILDQNVLLQMPWHQIGRQIKQIQNQLENFFSNSHSGVEHPAWPSGFINRDNIPGVPKYGGMFGIIDPCATLEFYDDGHGVASLNQESYVKLIASGINFPSINKNLALRLNNVLLQPESWINESSPIITGTNSYLLSGVLPGSGFRPLLEAVHQISWPSEFVRNINLLSNSKAPVITHQFTGECYLQGPNFIAPLILPLPSGSLYRNIVRYNMLPTDIWYTNLFFGISHTGLINVDVSGMIPTYDFTPTLTTPYGDQRNFNYKLRPGIHTVIRKYNGPKNFPHSVTELFNRHLDTNAGNVFVTGYVINHTNKESIHRFYDPYGFLGYLDHPFDAGATFGDTTGPKYELFNFLYWKTIASEDAMIWNGCSLDMNLTGTTLGIADPSLLYTRINNIQIPVNTGNVVLMTPSGDTFGGPFFTTANSGLFTPGILVPKADFRYGRSYPTGLPRNIWWAMVSGQFTANCNTKWARYDDVFGIRSGIIDYVLVLKNPQNRTLMTIDANFGVPQQTGVVACSGYSESQILSFPLIFTGLGTQDDFNYWRNTVTGVFTVDVRYFGVNLGSVGLGCIPSTLSGENLIFSSLDLEFYVEKREADNNVSPLVADNLYTAVLDSGSFKFSLGNLVFPWSGSSIEYRIPFSPPIPQVASSWW
jgi:hypothetical protein